MILHFSTTGIITVLFTHTKIALSRPSIPLLWPVHVSTSEFIFLYGIIIIVPIEITIVFCIKFRGRVGPSLEMMDGWIYLIRKGDRDSISVTYDEIWTWEVQLSETTRKRKSQRTVWSTLSSILNVRDRVDTVICPSSFGRYKHVNLWRAATWRMQGDKWKLPRKEGSWFEWIKVVDIKELVDDSRIPR